MSQPVGDVVSAKGPKDTFDESAQEQSPCEDDVNRGLVEVVTDFLANPFLANKSCQSHFCDVVCCCCVLSWCCWVLFVFVVTLDPLVHPLRRTPFRQTAQNCTLFFPLSLSNFRSFFVSLAAFSLNFGGFSEGRDLKCARLGTGTVV